MPRPVLRTPQGKVPFKWRLKPGNTPKNFIRQGSPYFREAPREWYGVQWPEGVRGSYLWIGTVAPPKEREEQRG